MGLRWIAPAGTITFAIRNAGTKVNEFYLYGAGDRIMGEAGLYDESAAAAAFRQAEGDTLEAASRRLRATRDLLLPGLISGDIDVNDVNIEVPDAV